MEKMKRRRKSKDSIANGKQFCVRIVSISRTHHSPGGGQAHGTSSQAAAARVRHTIVVFLSIGWTRIATEPVVSLSGGRSCNMSQLIGVNLEI